MEFSPLFEPKVMAVIGVSLSHDNHPANVIFNKNKYRYPMSVYPVNPKGGSLHEHKVYASVKDIPEKVDVAVIAARADHVPDIMQECAQAQVGGVVVISGGFAEVGRRDLEERMVKIARETWLPFIGPNCLGLFCPGKIDTFFFPPERMVKTEPGNVALVSQSGGILVDQIIKFAGEGVGVSRAVSIGNKALIREKELLEYLARDPATRVIVFYVEGFSKGEGRRFVEAAQACPKPVLVLKSGKSAAGMRAVSSHTASMAGDHQVFSAALKQYGVIEVESENQLLAFTQALSCYPKGVGKNIGIITASGGHGALAVDECSRQDLPVSVLAGEIQDKIRSQLTPSVQPIAGLNNPLDLTGSAVDDDFVAAATQLSRMDEIDCILVLLLPYLPSITTDLGARLSRVYAREKKPLVAYIPHVDRYQMFIEGLQINGIPVSHSIEGAVNMAEALRRCAQC